jgi:hypothetical protein
LRRGTYCIRRCVEGLGGTGIGRGAESAEAVQGLIVAERRDKVGRERVHRGPAEARNAAAAETGSFVEVWCASKRRKLLFFRRNAEAPEDCGAQSSGSLASFSFFRNAEWEAVGDI